MSGLLVTSLSSFAQNQVIGPVFKDGEAQVVPAFSDKDSWIKEELWVEANFDTDGDGKKDRMHVCVTRPAQTNSGNLKLPVVYMTSPYYGLTIAALMSNPEKYNWDVHHELGAKEKDRKHPDNKTREGRPLMASFTDKIWVPRGYVTVYSSSPGTGLSDGAPTCGGENEALAPKAVIDWLNGRAKGYTTRSGSEEVKAFWSSGKVGMTGTSYDGTLCLAAASTGVEGLEAIIPVAPISGYYYYYRSNGLVRSPEGYLGEDMDALYDFIHTGDEAKRARNDQEVRDKELVANFDRKTGDYNDFWAERDYLKDMQNVHAAVLMAHGFNDWNVMTIHSQRFYQAAKEKGLPTQMYYHQNGHGGDPSLTMMNRWFTRYLHGVENGVENDTPVQIVREHEKEPTGYSAYPDENAHDVTLHLKNGKNNVGALVFEKEGNQEALLVKDNSKIKAEDLVLEENAANRALYILPTLKSDVRLSGTPKVTVRLASNKPAANLSVYLISLPWEKGKDVKIYDNIINRSWADPQNHSSLTKGTPLVKGEFVEVSFDLLPDDQVVRAGQQIALMIFSSDAEFTILPKPGTELSIDPNGTTITLPVVGGAEALQEALK